MPDNGRKGRYVDVRNGREMVAAVSALRKQKSGKAEAKRGQVRIN